MSDARKQLKVKGKTDVQRKKRNMSVIEPMTFFRLKAGGPKFSEFHASRDWLCDAFDC